VSECPSRLGYELPVVTCWTQGELENAERVRVEDLTVRSLGNEALMLLSSGAHDELADAIRHRLLIGVLRSEPLVIVVVPIQDDVGVGVVKVEPPGGEGVVVSMEARREPRPVPVGERAEVRMRGEVVAQPDLFGGTGAATADVRALGVEGDDVPGADVVAVVPLGRIAG